MLRRRRGGCRRRGGGSPVRDSPTGTEGDCERRGQQAACHGDPTYDQTLVAAGDSEGDRTCQRPGPQGQLRCGDPRCSSPGEGGQKGGSPALAPPLGLLPRGRGVRAYFGGSGDRGTRLCPLERLPVSPRRRAAERRSRRGRDCCMCGCWMRRRRRRRRRGAAAVAGC